MHSTNKRGIKLHVCFRWKNKDRNKQTYDVCLDHFSFDMWHGNAAARHCVTHLVFSALHSASKGFAGRAITCMRTAMAGSAATATPEVATTAPAAAAGSTGAGVEPPVGGQLLRDLAGVLLRRCGPVAQRQIQQWALQTQASGGWAIGTMCSGSECPILVAKVVCEAIHDVFGGPRVVVKHCFSVELNPAKRAFIRKLFPSLRHLYADAHEAMGEPMNFITGEREALPECRMLVAGFPCVDVSAINHRANQHRDTVSMAAGRTGSVFCSICAFLEARPTVEVVVLENVPGLAVASKSHRGESNLDVCLRVLGNLGFSTCVFRLCPTMFGIPQHRPRLYIYGARRAPAQIGNTLAELMAALAMGHSMREIDDFLLPEGHPAIRRAVTAQRAGAATAPDNAEGCRKRAEPKAQRDPKKARRFPLWTNLHIARCAADCSRGASAVDWWDRPIINEALYTCFPGLAGLAPRERDLLSVHSVGIPERSARILDLSQGIRSANLCSSGARSAQPGISPCVLPGWRPWHTARCRFLNGLESLALQTVFYPLEAQGVLETFPSKLLHNLAGNAFNGACFLSVAIVSLCVPARPCAAPLLSLPLRGRASARLFGPGDTDDEGAWGQTTQSSSVGLRTPFDPTSASKADSKSCDEELLSPWF